jgi:hypothetical protein
VSTPKPRSAPLAVPQFRRTRRGDGHIPVGQADRHLEERDAEHRAEGPSRVRACTDCTEDASFSDEKIIGVLKELAALLSADTTASCVLP